MPRKKTNPAEETDQFQADELAEQAEAQAADVEFQTEPPEDVPSPTSDLSVPEIDLSDGDTTEAAEPIQSGVEDIAAETDSGALPASAPQTDTGAWEPVAEIVGVDLSEAVQPPPPSGSSPIWMPCWRTPSRRLPQRRWKRSLLNCPWRRPCRR